MITMTVKTNFPEFKRQLDGLRQDIADKVSVQTINDVATKARVEMKRAIGEEFNLKAGEINAQLNVKRASVKGYNVEAVLQAFPSKSGRRAMNVSHFLAKVTRAESKRRKAAGSTQQLGFKIKRNGGIVEIKGAFLGNAGRTVFMRTSRKRLPIVPVQTIDIPSMFNTKRINKRVIEFINQEFGTQFNRAMNRFAARMQA